MKNLRLYADQNGESHFEEVEATYTPVEYAPPAPAFEVSDPTETTRYIAVRFPAGWDSEPHPTPRRQVFVVTSGQFEGMTSDGTTVLLEAGDTVLMEDTTGKGHSAKVIGQDDVLGLMIHLE
jgi:hypothetical protein